MNEALRGPAPLACAERGLWSARAPENSVPALEAAISEGCEMAAFDLRRTREGDLVAFRDPELSRMTAARGPVAGLATASLTRLPLRGGEGGAQPLTNAYLPMLSEILAAARGRCALVLSLPDCADLDALALWLCACNAAGDVALRARFARPAAAAEFTARVQRHGLAAMPSLCLAQSSGTDILDALLAARPAMAELRRAAPEQVSRLAGPLSAAGIAVAAATDGPGDDAAEADPDGIWGALWEAGARVLSTARADALLRWRAGRVAA
ncbi:glycerophosphodiester phosphodiesterase family protein [Mangrovicoccus sp. HB161399]|uniref:glycerophosphodiester phosphodiesterase family protein n=1 Tax=Mangrovicoccus sp. HB161399 TaxID=2720392 RepID=UPI00155364C4|nr:glycerophosphodiester phosphodiesterase family protein [Mangrovicoccus sp. HB161399]